MVRDSIKFCGLTIPLPKSSWGYVVLAVMTVIGCFACVVFAMFSLGWIVIVTGQFVRGLDPQFLNVLEILGKTLGFVFVGACMVVFLLLCFSEDGLLR